MRAGQAASEGSAVEHLGAGQLELSLIEPVEEQPPPSSRLGLDER
jgi:hypothetical protein